MVEYKNEKDDVQYNEKLLYELLKEENIQLFREHF